MPAKLVACGARFPEKALLGIRVRDRRRIDDLQRHEALEIGIERLVGDAHRAPAKLEERTVLMILDFVVLELFDGAHGERSRGWK